MLRSDQATHFRPFILCLTLSTLLLLCRPSAAGPSEPTQHRQTLTVVSDDNYPPYIFRDAQGNLQGILPDEWRLWEEKTGIRVDLRGMDWGKAQKFMADGKADVIDTMFLTDERAKRYDFSKPYATLEVPIFFHKNISGITDIASLHGFVVGVKDGDACIDMLQRNGISTLKKYDNYEHIAQAAANRDISVFCMDKPPALYYLYKLNIEKEYRHSLPLYSGQFHRAVKKGRADLLGVVEGGFSRITAREHDEIGKKWMGTTLQDYPAAVRNIVYSLAGIVAIALLLVLWNMMLRKRVSSRTAELLATLAEHRRSKEFIETVFNSMHDAIAIVNVEDLTIVDANRGFVEKSGLPKAEVVGKKCHEITHHSGEPCTAHSEACPIAAMIESRATATLEHCHDLPGGRRECVEVTAAPILNEEGKVVQAVYITRDITERKLAEERIRKSEERYRNLFDSTLDGVYEVNEKGVFTQMNAAGARIFGYSSPDEIIGHKALEYWRDPGEREAFQAELKRNKSLSAYHMAGRKKDGGPLELESTCRIIEDQEGNFLGITGILRDVTERRRSEAEREKLIQQLRGALAEVRSLSGMLPICSSCKKIRDDKGYWSQIESYVSAHSGAEFTHGICPECEKKVYEELAKLTKGKP